ncbi:glycosyltransferase family 2 protein [Methylobacterium sp. A54F]
MTSHARTESSERVCVIIAAFNAEATIARAVASALAEPEVAEVIVVDDASPDRTALAAYAAGGGSERFTLIRQGRNRGPAAARNTAIAHARAPLLSILDADDYLLPGRMRRLLAAAPGHWDFLADDMLIVPEAWTGALGIPLRQPGDPAARTLGLAEFVAGNLQHPRSHRQEFGFLKPLMRRSFLDAAGLAYDPELRLGEDYALYVEALARGAVFGLTAACGYVAVERAGSLSGRHATADLARIAAFDARLLAGPEPLTAAERNALRAHRDATLRKWQYRRVLDRRRERGYGAALAELLRAPHAWTHILDATVRARTQGWARGWDRALGKARPQAPRPPRLLIGGAGVAGAS